MAASAMRPSTATPPMSAPPTASHHHALSHTHGDGRAGYVAAGGAPLPSLGPARFPTCSPVAPMSSGCRPIEPADPPTGPILPLHPAAPLPSPCRGTNFPCVLQIASGNVRLAASPARGQLQTRPLSQRSPEACRLRGLAERAARELPSRAARAAMRSGVERHKQSLPCTRGERERVRHAFFLRVTHT
jgi:hypothetical protein